MNGSLFDFRGKMLGWAELCHLIFIKNIFKRKFILSEREKNMKKTPFQSLKVL